MSLGLKSNRTKLNHRYHLISWGVPLAVDMALGVEFVVDTGWNNTQPVMGYVSRPWCWIAGKWAQLFLFYLPLALTFLFNAGLYLFLARKVSTVLTSMETRIRRRLLMYVHTR